MSWKFVCAVTVVALLQVCLVRAENLGRFIGTVKTEWIEPDRKMQLVDDFYYIDPSGQEWKAPKGSVIDGASIPSVLWSFVGSPFTGKYRSASVVHDVACVERALPWHSVHRMFYYASRLGGVGKIKAKIMYGAVWKFGPRWDRKGEGVPMAPISEARMNEDFEALKQFIERENPSLQRIEKIAEQ